jgi:hypothetical protein
MTDFQVGRLGDATGCLDGGLDGRGQSIEGMA